ncbi:hypothetical protein PMG11_11388 [Penicillium brasilianum]|uniref:Uncharacterized protein n=1 Tax=Penicillium brasilianum TaxID=104259 RepID=A0A0F7U1Z4_PENBI|nr:hypothetical protein PMG11_11388 [Penicillium brasilianum]
MVITHTTEHDETSIGLYTEWLQMFPPKPSRPSVSYDRPESATASPDDDCAFEYAEEESFAEEHQDTMDGDIQEQVEEQDLRMDTLSVIHGGNGTSLEESSTDPRLISKVFTECVDSSTPRYK